MTKTLSLVFLYSIVLNTAQAFVVLKHVPNNANGIGVKDMKTTTVPDATTTTTTCLKMCPGGWGIGTPIDMQDEEFSNKSTARRRRRRRDSFTGEEPAASSTSLDEVAYSAEAAERVANRYALEDAVKFTQRVRQERDNLQLQKKKDLMEIAKIAGLGDRLKPKVNQDKGGVYGKFEDDEVGEGGDGGGLGLGDDDDDLDVRVY